jgi:ATP-dependent Clp protease ATP-binding subunit ClpC
MYERFTDPARTVMRHSDHEFRLLNHQYIGTEHLLLGLVKERSGVAAKVLKNLDVGLSDIRREVEEIVPKLEPSGSGTSEGQLPLTPRAKRAIEYAMQESSKLKHCHIGTEHLLLGLLRERESTVRGRVYRIQYCRPTTWYANRAYFRQN